MSKLTQILHRLTCRIFGHCPDHSRFVRGRACEECGAELRPAELFGGPIRKP